ncbi:MAG: type III-A CRISPR-associated RAMP protein Csm3, partial [Magnetococcales bacterium]|nr:type III-A CRISPR-associated RAMP protein Csm3 [Magnetococcales bacterium]
PSRRSSSQPFYHEAYSGATLSTGCYIPGSSLKGKIRSLLEWRAGAAAANDGGPIGFKTMHKARDPKEAEKILKLFGVSGGDEMKPEEAKKIGPTRLAFRDCQLMPDWVEKTKGKNLPLTEVKMENTIDRVRGVAEHPRNVERVPAGAKFNFCLTVKQLGDEDRLLDTVFIGMKLLEMDSLGGSGSRGYGRIKFHLDDAKHHDQLEKAKPW